LSNLHAEPGIIFKSPSIYNPGFKIEFSGDSSSSTSYKKSSVGKRRSDESISPGADDESPDLQ